jgi:ubiquinone/menaquinone biosynthesis C-methylase UbiE
MNSDAGLHAEAGRAVDAAAYDRYIGRWSRLFVPRLLAAAGIAPGQRVLDVATGTGETALAAISFVGRAGVVVGVDISTAMVAAAHARLPHAYRAVIADGQALAFCDGGFDAVLCQLGLMFFSDPAQGLVEFRRVLRSGGRVAVCVASTPERAPMWGVLAGALGRLLPDRREMLHLTFSMSDPDRLEQMLGAAGFRDVRVVPEIQHGSFASLDEFWASIEAGVGLLPLTYRALPEPKRRTIREEVDAELARFEANGRLQMSVEMQIASGRA